MNFKQQLTELFEKHNKEVNYGSFFASMMYEEYDLNSFDDLTVEVVQSYGGEGQGDNYYAVYSFDNGTEKLFVKFNGWYASYHGAEFQDWFFVEPEEKTIIVYN